jgi:hypothetical protein
MYYSSNPQNASGNIATTNSDVTNPEAVKQQLPDNLTIRVISTRKHENCMSEEAKIKARENAPSLVEAFNQNVATDEHVCHWVGSDEFEINGLPKSKLHTFLLRAEELGKSITYTNTLTVKISD